MDERREISDKVISDDKWDEIEKDICQLRRTDRISL